MRPGNTCSSVTTCRRVSLVMAIGLLSLPGCGGGDELTQATGSALFAGKPIAFGYIDFVPDRTKGHKGPQGHAQIRDGRYDTALGGNGVVEGPHIVRITGYEKEPPPAPADETAPYEPLKPLFAGYAIESDINRWPQDFEVPESGKGFDALKATVAKKSSATH